MRGVNPGRGAGGAPRPPGTRPRGDPSGVVVEWTRGEPEPLGAARHGRVVDRLDVDPVTGQQLVGSALAERRVSDEHGDDVARGRHDRQAGGEEKVLQSRGALLVARALGLAGLEVPDARQGARGHDGRHRRGEDEARREAPDGIDDDGRAGDVPADDAEGLGERPLDHGDPVEHAVSLRDAGSASAVETNCVDLVEVGERSVARRHVAELPERRDVAVHRVDRLEADECRPGAADLAEVPLEVGGVVVAEDPLLGPAPAEPLIIEAWFFSSDRIVQPGRRRAIVLIAASLAA